MSKQLLLNLCGGRNGLFKQFLEHFDGEPRIAWYPSAGEDFRSLLYLHPKYRRFNLTAVNEPTPPDIFLFTDYYPWQYTRFLDNALIYSDFRTSIHLDYMEELPKLDLPLHPEIVDFPEGSIATNRVFFMKIRVKSDVLGEYTYPVVYAFAENEAFFCERLLPNKAVLSHIIHVRYGGGLCGGGLASGIWLKHALKALQCEVYLSDGHYYWQSGDEFLLELSPGVSKEEESLLSEFRVIPGHKWSGNGDVRWHLVG